MKVLHSGGFVNREYLNTYGTFNEDYKIAGDYDLLLRKGQNLKVVFIDQFLVKMGADGVSSTHVKKALQEARMARIHNKSRVSFLAWFDYIWIRTKILIKKLVGLK